MRVFFTVLVYYSLFKKTANPKLIDHANLMHIEINPYLHINILVWL